jgi:GntR family transcriptional repressor for pyruvate dehydrogenase complex
MPGTANEQARPSVSERFGALSGRASAEPTSMLRETLLAPIPMRTAGERIAERIVTAIALGEFVPDQRLPTERELAAMLEVSRTTVREALQRLQASGYVITKRGRGGGTFVRTGRGPDSDEMIRRTLVPAWADLSEILDFRRLVEQLIARTAAQRRDSRDIAAIRQAVDDYAKAADREASRLADHALHQAIARATHNARLVDLSARIRREVSLGFDAEPYTAEVRHRALRQHPRLADAVIAGNPVLAGDCAASHFSLTEDMLTELHARISLRGACSAEGGHRGVVPPGTNSLRSAGESDARSQSE